MAAKFKYVVIVVIEAEEKIAKKVIRHYIEKQVEMPIQFKKVRVRAVDLD